MEWLEASLAFIITMMMLSTIASMVVETLHRCLRLRERGLEQTLDALFEKVIWPKVASAKDMAGDGSIKELWQRNFVTTMTGNEFPKARERPKHRYLVWHWLKWIVAVGVGKLTNEQKRRGISTLEMVERLVETDVGRHISQRARELGKEAADEFKSAVVVGISDKFEDYSEEARDIFSRRAKLLSVLVGLVLAFGLNVDAPALFKSYLQDPALRYKIIAQGEAVAQAAQDARLSLEAELAQADSATLGEVKSGIEKITNQIKELEVQSIPLSVADSPLYGKELVGRPFWIWLLSVTLGGFLIGLGGPFWFDSFRKVSALTNIARQFVSPAKQTPGALAQASVDTPDTSVQVVAVGQSIAEETVVAIFKRAERSQALNWPESSVTKRSPRVLLGRDGSAKGG